MSVWPSTAALVGYLLAIAVLVKLWLEWRYYWLYMLHVHWSHLMTSCSGHVVCLLLTLHVCSQLLVRGADVDVQNFAGATPLMVSILLYTASSAVSSDSLLVYYYYSTTTTAVDSWYYVWWQCCERPDNDVARTLQLTTPRLLASGGPRERLVRADITRGREVNVVPAVNMVDDADFPEDFVYVSDYVETMPVAVNRVITSLQVCHILLTVYTHLNLILIFLCL